METKERLYIVSFGDSNKYKMPFADSKEALKKSKKLVDIEIALQDFVREKLPMAKASYFTTPVIIEVDPADEGKYAGYPVLDAAAVEQLKQTVLTEVEDMENIKCLSDDAPWSNIN